MSKRHLRVNVTFTFDDADVTRNDIVDRMDAAITEAFPDQQIDVHQRWVSDLADAALFRASMAQKGGA